MNYLIAVIIILFYAFMSTGLALLGNYFWGVAGNITGGIIGVVSSALLWENVGRAMTLA